MLVLHLTEADLTSVEKIQYLAYEPGLAESIEVLAAKRRLSPNLCFVAKDPAVLGYVIAHPWTPGEAPGLEVTLESLPADASVVHLHDLAVAPAAAGKGVARALLDRLEEAVLDAGHGEVTLVAVQGARSFWSHMGFEAVRRVDGYDETATFMRKFIRR